ncbi:hypothetical protein M9Y10_001762 [Tritrichomonas musculus]|uniref:Uncharacterized protein n=1 Tax=Tritrichomonas musculus TaxID=1915356 RepID=A0ABR2L8W1_9EUKA
MQMPIGQHQSAPVLPHPQQNRNTNRLSAEPSTLRNSYTPSSQSFLNDPECISIRDRLLNGDDPNFLSSKDENESPSFSMDLLQRLIIHLRELEERYAASANYQDAKKIHSIQISVKDEINSRLQNQNANSISNNSNEVDYINTIKKKHEQELNKFDNETNEKINNIEKLHQQSINRFEQSWNEKTRQYRKPSQHLIELKKTERNLAMIGQYDQATIVNTEATNLAKEEAAEKQKKILDDYRKARQKLIEKQNRELQSIVSNRAEQRLIIESKQQRETQSAVNRNFVFQQRNPNKALNSTHTLNPANSQSASNVAINTTSRISVPTTKKAFVIPCIPSRSSMRCRIYSLPPGTKASIWAKNATNGSRSSSVHEVGKGTSTSSCSNISIYDQQPSLLPPLVPPADPSITENEQKEKKDRIKQFQEASIRRENERKRRMELMKQEIEKEKQIRLQKQKILVKNYKKMDTNNNKGKECNEVQSDVISNKEKENNADDIRQTSKETTNSNESSNSENILNKNNNNNINDNDNNNINKNNSNESDDSEYYYYEEEEETIDGNEEDENNFVPISSCGSSSFHKLSAITSLNHVTEANADNKNENKNNNNNTISNNSKNSVKFKNDDNNLVISKNNIKENKMYDASDPLFHSAPSLKKMKESSQSEDIFVDVKNGRRLSSIPSKNGMNRIQSDNLTSMSVSDFEMDSVPLDVSNIVNDNYYDSDFTLNIPFDEQYLNSIEGKPTVLSQTPSTVDIKELTKQIGS